MLPLLFSASKRRRYFQRVLATRRANLIGYWPLWEPSGITALDISGATGRNGTHTGVTLGQPGIGDGRTCPLYDSTTDMTDIYSAGLAGAFNGAEGTFAIWGRVANAGVWTDATTRYIGALSVNGATSAVQIFKTTTANQLWLRYITPVVGALTVSATLTTTAWFHVAISWSKSNDQVCGYINSVLVPPVQTGLGVWAGALVNNRTLLGASTTAPANVWSGWLAHAAVWSAALTPTEIAAIARGR